MCIIYIYIYTSIYVGQKCWKILKEIEKDPRAAPFQSPVNIRDCPGYNVVVQRPMDLTTVRWSLASYESDSTIFLNDMRLVFDNCLAYNQNGSELYTWAAALKESLEGLYTEWINSDLHPHYSSQPPKAERLALKALNSRGSGSPEFKQGNGKWSYTPAAESEMAVAQALADSEAVKELAHAKKVYMFIYICV
jgi:hypothetical protein